MEPVIIRDYDPLWKASFERLAGRAAKALGPLLLQVHHIGSTSVPELAAKPIVDLVCELRPDASLSEAISRLGTIGYVHEGQRGIAGREAFSWPKGEERHHLYVTQGRVRELERQLAFRDHLLAHPEVARVYGALKRHLADRLGSERDAYTDAKTDFIEAVLAVARRDAPSRMR